MEFQNMNRSTVYSVVDQMFSTKPIFFSCTRCMGNRTPGFYNTVKDLCRGKWISHKIVCIQIYTIQYKALHSDGENTNP